VVLCKEILEHFLGRPVRHFAVPDGDWSERVVKAVRDAGFQSMRLAKENGIVERAKNPYQIPASVVNDPYYMRDHLGHVQGVFHTYCQEGA
jgi:hypothetical protein